MYRFVYYGGIVSTTRKPGELAAIKAVLKALKVPYKRQSEESLYTVKRSDIDQAYKEMRQGKYEVVEIDDLWK